MTPVAREDHSRRLFDAWQTRQPTDALTSIDPDLTIEDAYAIQQINLDRRIAEGARLVGRKVGLTNPAVQEWLGVDEPDFGGLLDTMSVPNWGRIDPAVLLQPRAEGEIAFVLKRDLTGPGITPHQVIAAVDFVLPSIEVIDSRIRDWKLKIEDTVADNASSGLFVVGSQPVSLASINTRTVGLVFRKNGRIVSTGAGADCLGDPINAVAWLANKLGELGTSLSAGQIVLSGCIGSVTDIEPGDAIEVEIGGVGRAGCHCGKGKE